MRGIVWLILLFVVAVVAATTLGTNDGIVSIYWSGWRTDLSLNFFVLLVVGFCLLLVLAVQAFMAITTLPQRASEWRGLRKERAAQAALREALAEYHGARYGRAQKAATRALDIQADTPALQADTEFTVLAQLLGAASAHALQDRPRRDALLAQAMPGPQRKASRADDGVRLLAAEWALEDRDGPRAQALLAELPAGVARRTQALRLKLQAARLLRDGASALHTARLLANHNAFSEAAAQSLLRSLAFDALDATHDPQQLQRTWDLLDAADRRDPYVAARAASRAGQLGAAALGRSWLRPFWDRLQDVDRDAREQLALALIAAVDGLAAEQFDWLPRLDAAAAAGSHGPAVAAAVAIAFAECRLWGMARRPLEATASAASLPGALRRRAWRQLAELAREEGDAERERACERAAAAID